MKEVCMFRNLHIIASSQKYLNNRKRNAGDNNKNGLV